jgi:hypothetical protein
MYCYVIDAVAVAFKGAFYGTSDAVDDSKEAVVAANDEERGASIDVEGPLTGVEIFGLVSVVIDLKDFYGAVF